MERCSVRLRGPVKGQSTELVHQVDSLCVLLEEETGDGETALLQRQVEGRLTLPVLQVHVHMTR